MKKQHERVPVCPQCGGQSWVTTTKGPRCSKCGYLKEENSFLQAEPAKVVIK